VKGKQVMGSEAKKFATYEDLLKVPDHLVAEIVGGELITSPRPSMRHAQASSSLVGDIQGPFQKGRGGPGGWWILFEPEIHLQGDILIPDIAGWKKDIVPELPTAKPYFEIAPQWVCEVISKSTARVDRVLKLPIYAREKVDYAWLIDPDKNTLEVFLRQDKGWFLLNTFAGNDKVSVSPFEAIEIDLGSLWLPD
jgi:Uma2 family endonuclease